MINPDPVFWTKHLNFPEQICQILPTGENLLQFFITDYDHLFSTFQTAGVMVSQTSDGSRIQKIYVLRLDKNNSANKF